ncbi:signal transduction histidine kinase [Methanosalsum zhilinae DSM 4017]|uniref:histidine kinase n=1 Tax=Methanosalsum zhilinae (strain DSM 4017 / NBRC 107636 / OCM 62 / WeN5) TaxID=679901 RepID=F7XL02_METZD|nr:histidine kinase dimerization/phosphoacceptor domain -containing protein [Methanosalsum zhilinae]AEH60701.1 signal transduction histidine kinase [Methanosalsum zhilinae DSM 4017]
MVNRSLLDHKSQYLAQQRKSSYVDLKKEKNNFTSIFNNIPEAVFICDLSGNILEINDSALNKFNFSLKKQSSEFIIDDFLGSEIFMDNIKKVNEMKFYRQVSPANNRQKKNSKNPIDCEVFLKLIQWNDSEAVMIIVHDIEDNIHSNKCYRQHFIKEVHHRVKNSLQVVNSLLSLQSKDFIDTEDVHNTFIECQTRIRSMAIAHERVSESCNIDCVYMEEYFKDLISYLLHIYRAESVIQSEISSKRAYLNIDTTVIVGLIINELISHYLKHTHLLFNYNNICLNLEKESQKNYILQIAIKNVDVESMFNLEDTDSFGTRLVSMLLKQIDGSMNTKINEPGMHVIRFQEL